MAETTVVENPVKIAALMSAVPTAHVPVDLTRSGDSLFATFPFSAALMRDSHLYDSEDLVIKCRRFTKLRSRLLSIKNGKLSASLSDLLSATA